MVDDLRPTLCIAERNANIRELLRREFGREGYTVLTAGSGDEVLVCLEQQGPIDLLILDAEMAGPDGGSLTPRLNRLHPRLPVVLHVFAGFEAVANGFTRVEKEGDFERLKGTVRDMLRQREHPADRNGDGTR
jgi:CheY-like chemotaxis protein